ncbi:heterokaryon incompatibility protein-domain-containing protein [Xylaria longipes]|nr:heterokaryon incompatibility protein-domain-containing protein [Xylaria longipes]
MSLTYEQLAGCGQIRLLRILRTEENSYGFELELLSTSLNNITPYTALSYTWGPAAMQVETGEPYNDETRVEVKCNRASLQVTENLFDFLLCEKDNPAVSTTLYWIDQICINQEDLAERSQQVAIMGSIFKSAEKVHVWLGKDDPPQGFVWVYRNFLPIILELHREFLRQGLSHLDMVPNCDSPEILRRLGVDVCEGWRKNRRAFFMFFYIRRWFCRGWIVQEIMLKESHEVALQCGSYILRWDAIVSFHEFLHQAGWYAKLPRAYIPWTGEHMDSAGRLSTLLHHRIFLGLHDAQGTESMDWRERLTWISGYKNKTQRWFAIFIQHLQEMRNMSLRDPRDYVFSLLGIMSGCLPPEMAWPIIPDYKATVDRVFIDITKQFLVNASTLYPLSMVNDGIWGNPKHRQDKSMNWPSWTPDYSNTESFTPGLSAWILFLSDGKRRFDASKTDSLNIEPPSFIGDTLVVHGAVIQKIRTASTEPWEATVNLPNLLFILSICAQEDNKYPHSPHTWIEAVWRTLLADCIPRNMAESQCHTLFRFWLLTATALVAGGIKNSERNDHNVDLAKEICQRVSSQPSLLSSLPALEEIASKKAHGMDCEDFKALPFQTHPLATLWRRRLFLTNDHYLGFGPPSLAEGDEVWLLKGGRMPFILRKAGAGGYQLVGEAYLHGALDGELMTEENISRLGPVEII